MTPEQTPSANEDCVIRSKALEQASKQNVNVLPTVPHISFLFIHMSRILHVCCNPDIFDTSAGVEVEK